MSPKRAIAAGALTCAVILFAVLLTMAGRWVESAFGLLPGSIAIAVFCAALVFALFGTLYRILGAMKK